MLTSLVLSHPGSRLRLHFHGQPISHPGSLLPLSFVSLPGSSLNWFMVLSQSAILALGYHFPLLAYQAPHPTGSWFSAILALGSGYTSMVSQSAILALC